MQNPITLNLGPGQGDGGHTSIMDHRLVDLLQLAETVNI